MQIARIAASLVAVTLAAAPLAAQSRVLVQDNPWGQGATLEARFTDAFGAGAWTGYGYGSADAATVFSAGTRTVWLDGGASTDHAMANYLTTNRALIEGWVHDGGRLVLNAAPWNIGMDYGFGGVTLHYGAGTVGSTATAVDPTAAIFQGPAVVGGTTFSGNSFSHAYVTGDGLTGLLQDEMGRFVLAEMTVGSGRVLFGGMTTDNWHSGVDGSDPQALRTNILHYVDAAPTTTVPEPASMALVGAGLAAVGAVARRRRATA